MIGDQLTYLEAPFYNSNCSKPNGSASPFGEAQFDETPRHAQPGTIIWMSLKTSPNKELQQHKAMRVLHFLPPLPQNTPMKTCRGLRSSVWIRSSRVKAVVRNPQAASTFGTNRTLFAPMVLRSCQNAGQGSIRRSNLDGSPTPHKRLLHQAIVVSSQ